jgi:hypothetical protein
MKEISPATIDFNSGEDNRPASDNANVIPFPRPSRAALAALERTSPEMAELEARVDAAIVAGAPASVLYRLGAEVWQACWKLYEPSVEELTQQTALIRLAMEAEEQEQRARGEDALAKATNGSHPFAVSAEALFANGYGPLPESANKIPCFKGWSDYYPDETRTPEEIRELVAKYPRASLSVVCGYNRLLSVDIDTDNKDIINAILAKLPAWTVAKRGSKGLTIFFRYAGDLDWIDTYGSRRFSLKGADDKEGDVFCEVLWMGRKTTIPPTIHAKTGSPYAWIMSTRCSTPPSWSCRRSPRPISRLSKPPLSHGPIGPSPGRNTTPARAVQKPARAAMRLGIEPG